MRVEGENQKCGRHAGNMPHGAPRRSGMRTKRAVEVIPRTCIHETRPPCRFSRLSCPGFAEAHSDRLKTRVSACRLRQSRTQALADLEINIFQE